MVVKAFRDKCYPLGGKGLEWCIYHGLKWCLSLTKVLIIQSEEELPAHYLRENNNVNTRLPGPSQCRLSELVSCSTIHSISTSTVFQDSFPVLLYLSLPFSFTLPTLPHVTSQCLAGCPHTPPLSPTPPAHFLPFCKPLLLHPSTLLGPDEPLWDSSRWMGNKGVRGGPPLPVPLVSLPTRLWVIFSSFHGRAMNNLSLLSETQAPPQPPPSYLTLCRLARAGCSPDSISHPRFLLTVSALHTQSGFFFVSRGVLQGPEINWGCGWMTSGPSFIKVWVLEVCRVYNEVYIS